MPSSGSAKAVSDYEHLLSQRWTRGTESLSQADDSGDSDFLPLKPSKSINKGKSTQDVISKFTHGASMSSDIKGKNKIGLTQMLDDFGYLQTMGRVPVPTAWSPGMLQHVPNPALLITPEKLPQHPKQADTEGKENLLEPQTSLNIPKPVPWSPGMVLKPNPGLLITPDKTETVKGSSQPIFGNSAVAHGTDSLGTRSKEKHSVRFDLPSASSGDETMDASQDFLTSLNSHQSPITLKGRDIGSDDDEPVSPPWKAFSPQKAYDPSAYSDESTLEDSIQNPSHPLGFGQQMSIAHHTKDIDDTTSDRLADKLQELLLSSSSETFNPGLSSNVPSEHSVVQSAPLSCTETVINKSTKASSRKVMSAMSMTRHPGTQRHMVKTKKDISTGQDHKAARNAGPEFLKTPPSPYEPRPTVIPQPHVIRESEGVSNSPEQNNYAFPFDASADGISDSEHAFARPEYNSTLRVRSELDELCQREVDVERALATALVKSEDKRTELNEKASVYTNRMSNQFRNLVDLEPSVDSLCSRVVRMRTNKVPAKKTTTATSKSSKSIHSPPDLMEFLPPDLQRETPDFSMPGVKSLTQQLKSAPHDLAFDLYRHNRVWQGISDY